ncbi:MAG: hypothetical protein ABFS86_05270 [Planctomycetota bacterium]
MVLVLVVASVMLVGAFLTTSLARVRDVELQVMEASAWNAAESAMNEVVESLWPKYRDADPKTRVHALDGLDGSSDPLARFRIDGRTLGRSTYRAEVTDLHVVEGEYVDVKVVATGENIKASRTLTAVIRYGHKPAQVFDHAYFINNFGWLWGAGVTVNGSVRSNGNLSLKSATVNGDIYASENEELGAIGSIEGDARFKDLVWYNDHYGDRIRPSNPTAPTEDANGNGVLDFGEDANGNGKLDEYELRDGYNGAPEKLASQAKVVMPYLGDLSDYTAIAKAKGGTLSHGGKVVVNAVLGDDVGEQQNLLLVGTDVNPIIINGPVVVKNDVVLKGVIKGQGTIFAGRNVHIIGNLTYADPPAWPKRSTDMGSVHAANATKDMVGLAAKGSVLLGDYTGSEWLSVTRKYQTAPFTQPYIVDPSDAANGYVSYIDKDGNPVFDGNYRAYDGGMKDDGGGGLTARKFYESSFSDAKIRANADSQVRQVDAIIYTNHMLSGKVGASTFNGALVSRDEAIVYDGSLFVNYDIRTSSTGYEFLDIYLPRDPARRIIYWGEGR